MHFFFLRVSTEYYGEDDPIPACLTDDGLVSPFLFLHKPIGFKDGQEKAQWRGGDLARF